MMPATQPRVPFSHVLQLFRSETPSLPSPRQNECHGRREGKKAAATGNPLQYHRIVTSFQKNIYTEICGKCSAQDRAVDRKAPTLNSFFRLYCVLGGKKAGMSSSSSSESELSSVRSSSCIGSFLVPADVLGPPPLGLDLGSPIARVGVAFDDAA